MNENAKYVYHIYTTVTPRYSMSKSLGRTMLLGGLCYCLYSVVNENIKLRKENKALKDSIKERDKIFKEG